MGDCACLVDFGGCTAIYSLWRRSTILRSFNQIGGRAWTPSATTELVAT